MKLKLAQKSKIITLRDYEVGRPKKIKNDIVVIYLVVNILNSKIGEDAIHLHIDLNPSIDRNIFTEDFCNAFFEKLPENFYVYTGSDGRCKFENIEEVEDLIDEVRLEEKNKQSILFNLLGKNKKIDTANCIDSKVKEELKKLLDKIIERELSKIDITVIKPEAYNINIKNKDDYYICMVKGNEFYSIEKLEFKPAKYIDLIELI